VLGHDVAGVVTQVGSGKDALWYLGQSRDPKALDLFEELLAGR